MCVCVCVCVGVGTPRTVAHQAPLSLEFSMQEYWSELPFPSAGDFLTQVLNLGLPCCGQILYHLRATREAPSSKRRDTIESQDYVGCLSEHSVVLDQA